MLGFMMLKEVGGLASWLPAFIMLCLLGLWFHDLEDVAALRWHSFGLEAVRLQGGEDVQVGLWGGVAAVCLMRGAAAARRSEQPAPQAEKPAAKAVQLDTKTMQQAGERAAQARAAQPVSRGPWLGKRHSRHAARLSRMGRWQS